MRLLSTFVLLLAACSTVTTMDSFDATRGAVVITRSDDGSRAIDDELTETLALELDLTGLAETSLPIDLTVAGTAMYDAETDTWSFEAEPDHSLLVPAVTYDRSCFCSWIGTDYSSTIRGQLRITSFDEDQVKGRVTVEGEFDGGEFSVFDWSMSRRFDVDR